MNIRECLELKLLINNHVLLDEKTAKLLYLIREKGSILKASRILGISYSTAWDMLDRLEKLVGREIIVRKKGVKGGAVLTDTGIDLLGKYMDAYQRIMHRTFKIDLEEHGEEKYIVYAGSHDVLLTHLLGYMSREKYYVDINWIGSLKGLSSIILGETDLAGIHLYDPDTGEYNIPLIKKYGTGSGLVLIRGWFRSIGFGLKNEMSIDEVFEEIVDGGLRIVNRNKGSGTRILFEHLLEKYAARNKLDLRKVRENIEGYGYEVSTHDMVAEAIASGRADTGLLAGYVAVKYGLKYIHVCWERFDLVTTLDRFRGKLSVLKEILSSREFRGLVEGLEWYRVGDDFGKIFYF